MLLAYVLLVGIKRLETIHINCDSASTIPFETISTIETECEMLDHIFVCDQLEDVSENAICSYTPHCSLEHTPEDDYEFTTHAPFAHS